MSERHIYYCNHSQTNRIFWQLNGSRIESFDVPLGVSIGSGTAPGVRGGRVPTLTIEGLSEHNQTTVQCIAELNDISSVVTPGVMFLIQG